MNTSNNSSNIGNSNSGLSLMEQLMALPGGSPVTLSVGAIVTGRYVGPGLVSCGSKCDANLHKLDLNDDAILARLGEGASLPFVVTSVDEESEDGVVVSAILAQDWNAVIAAQADGTLVPVTITGKQKKGTAVVGLKVKSGHLNGFVPRSHLKGVRDIDALVGKEVSLKVQTANPAERSLVFDFTSYVQAEEARQQAVVSEAIRGIVIGTCIKGTVRKVIECGALVEIGGGVCGLVHNSELVNKPATEGAAITVVVIGKDEERQRISLSERKGARKQQLDSFYADHAIGNEFSGKVANIQPYGVFVELVPGVRALLHRSRFDSAFAQCHNAQTIRIGDEVNVRITRIDAASDRIDVGCL